MHELKRINPAQLRGQNFSAACSKWMAPQGPKHACMPANVFCALFLTVNDAGLHQQPSSDAVYADTVNSLNSLFAVG